MKTLLITSLLALTATQADAGDLDRAAKKFFNFHKKIHRVHVKAHRTVQKAVLNRHARHRDLARRRHECRQVWVPVRYETVRRKVWVPAYNERVWHPGRTVTRYDDCGRPYTVRTRGHYDIVRIEGRYEYRTERVRSGGFYKTICNTRGHRHVHNRR